MNLIQNNFIKYENNSQPNLFTKCGDFFSIFTATANSVAEPENSNLYKAYSNTPLNACFFMRSTNTPRRKTEIRLFNQSMVACYGKGFALCCVPCIAVSQPVTRYRQSLRTFAVTLNNQYKEIAMLYLFKAVSRSDLRNTKKHFSLFPRYTVRINADSIKQATAQVAPYFVILEAREANSHLIKKSVSGSIASTITIDADRKRYSSGIFLSQIYPSQGEQRPRSIDFAIRSIRGNKASNRTNNPSRSIAVVEAVSHPLKGDTSNLLTQLRISTMKTITKPTALMAGTFPIAFTSAMAEVRNA